MRINVSTLSLLVDDLKKKINHSYITNITVVNSHDFLFSFSALKKEKLFISLGNNPILSLIEVNESIPTMIGKINDSLRKEIKDSYILDINLLDNDRVIEFTVEKTNQLYEQEKKVVIIELIPNKTNLLVLNVERNIVYALRQTSLVSPRVLLKGFLYVLPEKNANFKDEEAVPLSLVKEETNNQFELAKNIRHKEKHQKLFQYLKSKKKSLNLKINKLEIGINVAKEMLKYKENGNAILYLMEDINSLNEYLSSNHIPYDNTQTPARNAEILFKKYKKAKRTIEINNLEKEKANKELDHLAVIEAQIPYMNDDELTALSIELVPSKNKQSIKNKKIPISYVECDGCRIYFGKTKIQNEEITFKIAKKDDIYLHIKDYHGAHVVIVGNNINNEILLTAAEMCLILSNKTVGEVMYTPIYNVKKAHVAGEALLNKYQLIVLNKIRDDTYHLLKKYKNL